MTDQRETIIHYYDTCETDYRRFWNLERSLAMHAGYWDHTTRNLSDALAKENEVLAQIAQINASDIVLDAGCGVGGSSIFLAEKYHCKVTGITLSAKQVATAQKYAQKLQSPPQFLVQDYCQTHFPNETFTVVWGLESICHAHDKSTFLNEAYRLLKPGGRLIVADGFAERDSYPSNEKKWMAKWLNGWGVDTLETATKFEAEMWQAGFNDCKCLDITANVLPSSKKLYQLSFPAYVLSKLGEWAFLRTKTQTANIVGAYYQYLTLKKGLWSYKIFSAHK